MAIQTELTRALGIKIPLVQGGMQWVSHIDNMPIVGATYK